MLEASGKRSLGGGAQTFCWRCRVSCLSCKLSQATADETQPTSASCPEYLLLAGRERGLEPNSHANSGASASQCACPDEVGQRPGNAQGLRLLLQSGLRQGSPRVRERTA